MKLSESLAAFKAEFAVKAPEGRVALYEAKIAELMAEFARRDPAKVGDQAPDFTLPDAQGGQVSLTDLLREGPVVLTFYRGGWCPYCNLQLRAYQDFMAGFQALGARLVAVSPQTPDNSLSTAEANALSFDVLSDVGNHVARDYGLAYTLPVELQEALTSVNKILPDINGDGEWDLPVPATFVIDGDGRIALAHLDIDYRERLDPEDIVAALKQLGGGVSVSAAAQ